MPDVRVDVPFSLNRRPRSSLIQAGSTRRFQRRPNYNILSEYEAAAVGDTALASGINTIIETMLSMAGPISHPDPEIQDFLRYSLEHLEYGWKRRFREAAHTSFWAGNSITEVLFKKGGNGLLVHDDLMCYHPSTLMLRVNKRGRLTEGEPAALEGHKSGIYQMPIEPNYTEALIPRWKSIYLVNDPRHNNVYGNPLVALPYKYVLLKETYEEMMTTALDRYGHPLIWIKVGAGLTEETVVDPLTGQIRQLTVQESVERDIQNLSGGNVLVFTQTGDIEPDVQSLTTGNNIGSTFLEAISYCDMQIYRGLLVPFVIIGHDADRMTSSGGAERQMELFRMIMRSLFEYYVNPFAEQLCSSLIKYHFNRESAHIPPYFPIRQVTRPEERVAMMQMIVGLTNSGYFNPQNEQDWAMVRQFVDANERDRTPEDEQYIHDMVVGPLLKDEPTTGSTNEKPGRSPKKGKPGRPTGNSSPQISPRPSA